jgi:integrase
MKKLEFKKFKGLHIVCKGCGKQIEISSNEYNGCLHPIEKQKYKAVIRYNGVRKTKDLKAVKYDAAVKELIEFKEELKNPFKLTLLNSNKEQNEKQYNKLIDCIKIYCDYLENVNVPFFEQRIRTERYVKDTIGYLLKFKDYLESSIGNSNDLTIFQIDKKIVGEYFEMLLNSSYSISTYNHHVRTLKGFYKFLIEKKGFDLISPMRFAKTKNVNPNTIAVKDEDFKRILNCFENTPEKNTIKILDGGEKKKMYRPYFKEAVELVAYTGMRITEAISIKFSDIITNENGEIDYVRGIDLKYEKTHNYDNSKPVKYVPIPITPELEELLIRLDYKNYLGKDRYLIAPDESITRDSLTKQLTHSFSYYRDKAGVTSKIGLKHLRKTFLTKIQIATGMVTSLGYQKTASVIQNNYIDKSEIAKSIKNKGFRLFNIDSKIS